MRSSNSAAIAEFAAIQGQTKSKTHPQWELYNLNIDPLELSNLAEINPEQVKKLSKLLSEESDQLGSQAAKR